MIREAFSPTLDKTSMFVTYIELLRDSMKVLLMGSIVIFFAAIGESAIIVLRG